MSQLMVMPVFSLDIAAIRREQHRALKLAALRGHARVGSRAARGVTSAWQTVVEGRAVWFAVWLLYVARPSAS